MTVENVANKVREDGNGSKVAFTFSFKIYKTTDIKVYKVVKATGVATLQTITTDYTVAINTVTDGGTVTYVVAPTSLQESFLISDFDTEQQTNIPDRGAIRESQIEKPLDLLTLLLRQLQEVVDRCVRFTLTSQQSGIEMPEPEASKIPGWNATADGMENYDNPAVAEAAAAASAAAALVSENNAESAETNAVAAKVAAEAAAALIAVQTVAVSVSGGAVATDASALQNGGVVTVTANANFTLSNPTNPTAGKKLIWRIQQDGTGSRIITLGDKFTVCSEINAVVLSTAAGAIDHIGAIYKATTDKWEVIAFASEQA